jgi:hypothetical protein
MSENGTAIEKSSHSTAIESALVNGDLAKLSPDERITYYLKTCESLGLSPYTKPFLYIILNGKLTLYASRDAADQLRRIHGVSIVISAREKVDDIYIVTARATLPSGRTDESTGAVSVANLKGENLANAYLKAETKAKRRVTLSIVGLGMLDETEIESIPEAAKVANVDAAPVAAEDIEALTKEWQTRFETAATTAEVEKFRNEFKTQKHSDELTLIVSKFYAAAKKRVKGVA